MMGGDSEKIQLHNKTGANRWAKAETQTLEEAHAWLVTRKQAINAQLSLHAAQIGEYLIETFYQGREDLVTSQASGKDVSLRKLAERADSPFSLSALRTFLQVAMNFRRLPQPVAAALPVSHHAILYRVADEDERADMAAQATEEKATAATLRQWVRGKGRRKTGGGRKPDCDMTRDFKDAIHCLRNAGQKLALWQTDQEGRAEDMEQAIRQARLMRDELNRLLASFEPCLTEGKTQLGSYNDSPEDME